MTHDTTSIRNLAIVGHGGSGKTTLSEAMLLEAGLATRVPAGIMDYHEDEKERGNSIDASIAQFSWNDNNYTIIDAPGYQEFVHNSIGALSTVETALILVSATDGITINSRRMWNICEKNGQARIIVVTKLDADNVSFEDTVAQIQEQLSEQCKPLVVPSGSGSQLNEVHNVVDNRSEEYADHRKSLVEAIVETDDDMMEKYLEGEDIPTDSLRAQFKKGIHAGQIYPIVTVCPSKSLGIKELLQVITNLAPSPLDVTPKKGKVRGTDEEKNMERSPDAPFTGQVFKVFNDPFGRICYLKVISGTLNSSSTVTIANSEKTEKIGNLLTTVGKDHKNKEKAVAGEIVAVSKVENMRAGDTLSEEKGDLIYPVPEYPKPMVQYAAQPLSRGDEQKIYSSLAKLNEEDPTFQAHRHEETSELIVSGMSTLHLDVMLGRLKSRFKVECSTKLPRIPYRETLTGSTDTRYRHKKQSGGSGQYAEVAIKLEPAERGKGLDFVNKIVGGVVPGPYIVSCEKGIDITMKRGILAGYPVIDAKVTLYDGKTHDVDSSDAAFQVAASKAFQEAFLEAKPVLLEPLYKISVTVPTQFMGDIMGDLNTRRGRIQGTESEGNSQTIIASVPLSEIMTYSTELKAITGGEGTYTSEFLSYDAVPSHVQDKIVAQAKKEED